MYSPRVTILSLHLTEIIYPYMTTYGSPKSRYKHIYTSPYNSPNGPRAEQTGSCEKS